ncbi:MAG: hypothetical protein QOJ06_2897 [Pseudonocardiales bacterium]|jgi:hypothetical protein|nr:hypothetical protein [Pseudonocardiales bacterium]
MAGKRATAGTSPRAEIHGSDQRFSTEGAPHAGRSPNQVARRHEVDGQHLILD